MEESSVGLKRTERLGLVSFCEVHADQRRMGALAKRIRLNRGPRCLDGVSEAPDRSQLFGQRLESVQPKLAPILRFDSRSVLVPVW